MRVKTLVHPIDHHMHALAALDDNLGTTLMEPLLACQVRGLQGSRNCFGACPPLTMSETDGTNAAQSALTGFPPIHGEYR